MVVDSVAEREMGTGARCSPMSVIARAAAAQFIAQRSALGAFLVAR
jgi:hypothetical protein